MPTIAEVRQKFPQYEDMSDEDLASALHRKFYADMPEDEFRQKVGLQPRGVEVNGKKGDASRWGAGQEAVSGATFGFNIPLGAAVTTPLEMIKQGTLNPVEAYQSARDQVDADREAWRQAHPVGSVAANLAGGMATGGVAGKGGLTLAGKVGAGPVAKVAEAAGEGAIYGGLTGLGEARGDLGDQLAGAAQGATVGGLAGGALGAAGQVIGAASTGTRSAIQGIRDPEGFAARKVAQTLAADGTDPSAVASDLFNSPKGTVLADVAGENTRDLLRTVNNTRGMGRQEISDLVDERMAGQRGRMMEATSKKLAPGELYNATLDDITSNYRAKAAPLYERAYAKPVKYDDFQLDELMPRIPRSVWGEAQDLMNIEGYTPKQIIAQVADDGSVKFNRVPDMKQWDYVKRGLDSMITKEDGAGAFGGTTPKGRALGDLKKELLGILDKQNPSYKAARQLSSDMIGLKKSLENGPKLLNMSGDDVKRAMAKMSKAEREATRIGIARAIRDKVLAGTDGSDRVKAVWTPKMREVVAAAFEGDKVKDFAKFMEGEAAKMKTVRAASGNSTTARQLAAMEDGGMDPGVVIQMAQGNWAGALLGAIGRQARKMGGLNEKSAKAMSDILLSGPGGKQIPVDKVAEAMRQIERGQRRGIGIRPSLPRSVGLLGGYSVSQGDRSRP